MKELLVSLSVTVRRYRPYLYSKQLLILHLGQAMFFHNFINEKETIPVNYYYKNKQFSST